jgi:tRNA dimethylallyltransferase
LGAAVLSVDSMQVYRGMDVGTAKPSLVERRGIVHHMIDVAGPGEDFSVADFARLGREVIGLSKMPIVITGGSGLHFRSLVDPMSFAPTDPFLRVELESREPDDLVGQLVGADPDANLHLDLANQRRVVRALEVLLLTGETPSARAATAEAEDLRRYRSSIAFTALGIDAGDALGGRVSRRLEQMREDGFVDEVGRMWDLMGRNARTAVGYREIRRHLEGETSLEEAFSDARRATLRLARQQRTWFQRDPRIRWIPWLEDIEHLVERVMEALD